MVLVIYGRGDRKTLYSNVERKSFYIIQAIDQYSIRYRMVQPHSKSITQKKLFMMLAMQTKRQLW